MCWTYGWCQFCQMLYDNGGWWNKTEWLPKDHVLGLSEGGGRCEEFELVPRESSLSINGEGKIEGQLAHLEKWPLHSLYNCLFVCLLTTSYGKNCWSALPEMYPWTRKRQMSSDFNVVDSLAQGLWCAYQDRTHNSTLNFGSHLDLDPNLGIFSMNFFHTLS